MKKGGGTTTLSRYEKRESLCNSIVAQKNEQTNRYKEKTNGKKKGVAITLRSVPATEGNAGEGRVQSKSLGKWGRSAKATTIWRT